MKIKINNEGDPCRNCGLPVIKRISEFKMKKLKKPYFYTAYYWCGKCKIFYMHDKFKVINEKNDFCAWLQETQSKCDCEDLI